MYPTLTNFYPFLTGCPDREEHVKQLSTPGQAERKSKGHGRICIFATPYPKQSLMSAIYQGSSSFLWMQFNNNAVILDPKKVPEPCHTFE